jgi:hypothetical protein
VDRMTDQPDLHIGKEWSKNDLFSLRNRIEHGRAVGHIATFLRRTEGEVREKAEPRFASGAFYTPRASENRGVSACDCRKFPRSDGVEQPRPSARTVAVRDLTPQDCRSRTLGLLALTIYIALACSGTAR